VSDPNGLIRSAFYFIELSCKISSFEQLCVCLFYFSTEVIGYGFNTPIHYLILDG
jgi:hypothetical protein